MQKVMMVASASVDVALDVSSERTAAGFVTAVETVVTHPFFGNELESNRDRARDKIWTGPNAVKTTTHFTRYWFE